MTFRISFRISEMLFGFVMTLRLNNIRYPRYLSDSYSSYRRDDIKLVLISFIHRVWGSMVYRYFVVRWLLVKPRSHNRPKLFSGLLISVCRTQHTGKMQVALALSLCATSLVRSPVPGEAAICHNVTDTLRIQAVPIKWYHHLTESFCNISKIITHVTLLFI